MGEITARDSRALGVQWVFFPDADVNSNPDNPIINIRSFGENPAVVSEHVRAYIEGARSRSQGSACSRRQNISPATATRQSTAMCSFPRSVPTARIWTKSSLFHFAPRSKRAVDAVMTAHIAVPALDAPEMPATLSSAIMTGLLRNELKFTGW